MKRYYATAKEMRELDALAVAHGLEIRQMMELAGYHMVALFRKLRVSTNSTVLIVCGKGNKGGDGLSAARHLYNNGYHNIKVILLSKHIKKDPRHHLRLLKKMKVKVYEYTPRTLIRLLKDTDVVMDALIGYNLDGAPRGVFKDAIENINSIKNKVVAYDIPSGIKASDGSTPGASIKAYATLALALPKRAFKTKRGKSLSGRIFLADIGIPNFLYNKIRKGSRPDFEAGITLL